MVNDSTNAKTPVSRIRRLAYSSTTLTVVATTVIVLGAPFKWNWTGMW
jgi:hypothetical protein